MTGEIGLRKGFDIGLKMSGHPRGLGDLFNDSFNGATISPLGIFPEPVAIDWDKVIFDGLETQYRMSSMVKAGLDVSKMPHRFHYTDFEKGIATMLSSHSGKVVLDWEND